MLENSVRLQYLQAMGIDVWVSRVAQANSGLQESNVELGMDATKAPDMPIEKSVSKENASDVWVDLEAEVSGCVRCGLCVTRTKTVFGTGDKQADWMFIGEAPGQSEDEQGKPFVGKAGQLLTEMIRAIGLEREGVYIANVLKCRPPNNRDPKPEEIELCSDYLRRQRALVQPKIILAVGRIAAQALLMTDEPIGKLRSKVHQLDDIPLVVVYHPAYLLRSPLEKRKAWRDLQLAMRTFKHNIG